MKKSITLLTFSLFLLSNLLAQDWTSLEVYEILQTNCANCHSNGSPQAGLDLEGAGANVLERAQNVFNNIFEITPSNTAAAQKGDAYIYPGRPDKSFLFRKINQGLEATVNLDAEEGQSMPAYGGPPELSDVDKEMIRQWILYGAPLTGKVVEKELIEDYYAGNGVASFPDGPPPAPAPSEGFQIKMGPFYVAPAGELEYFQKYELDMPDNQDVNRLDLKIGTYSHHLIIYDFEGNGANNIAPGLRLDPFHANIGLIAAIQETTDLRLPQGTAFRWEDDLVLDLNSHYINYSANMVHQAEVYVNVYTQPEGEAAQEMYTELVTDLGIYIPNSGSTVTETDIINPNLGDIYLWGIMGHTHKYGTSYKAWTRANGQADELIYDAACAQGTPGCISPYFDYRHIPMRYFEPLKPITVNFFNGIVHEASWINDGPEAVSFGPTSDDEMMVMVLMFTDDSTGVEVVPTREVPAVVNSLKISPQPAQDWLQIFLPDFTTAATLVLHDVRGAEIYRAKVDGEVATIQRGNWPAGVYSYQLFDQKGHYYTGKIIWQ